MSLQIQKPNLIIEKDLLVMRKLERRKTASYMYGYLSIKLPKELIGKRVRVIIIAPWSDSQ